MRTVLHLIDTGGPGGAETVYVELVAGLDAARWRSVAVVPTREWMLERLEALGADTVFLPERPGIDLAHLARLAALVRERRVDLVHAHLFGPALTAGLLSRLCRVPAVATLHGEGDLRPDARLRRLKLALVGRGVRRLVFVSEPLRRSFLAGVPLPAARAAVIPNGIDVARFAPGPGDAFRRELGIGADEFVVGAVGNVRAAKGYDVLLRAADILARGGEGWRFVVVGQAQGELYRELLEMRDALGLAGRVLFTGFRDDVPAAMRAFDAFVLPSRSEGFSLSTVQAMASGLPVAATRCGGPETLLEDGATGLLVENGSPDAVAGALARLRGDAALRARLGEAALRAARERFTVQAQVRAYERLYDEVLGARRGARARAESTAPAERFEPGTAVAAGAEGGAAWHG